MKRTLETAQPVDPLDILEAGAILDAMHGVHHQRDRDNGRKGDQEDDHAARVEEPELFAAAVLAGEHMPGELVTERTVATVNNYR